MPVQCPAIGKARTETSTWEASVEALGNGVIHCNGRSPWDEPAQSKGVKRLLAESYAF